MVRKKKLPKTRSKFEDAVLEALNKMSIPYKYEAIKIKYQKKVSVYTPDLVLDNGVIVEIKGYFDAEDRAKHLLIREQHPQLDIRFVFQKPGTKIHKLSTTTYGDWCDKNGITYASKEVPPSWAEEVKGKPEQVSDNSKPRQRKTVRKDTTKGEP